MIKIVSFVVLIASVALVSCSENGSPEPYSYSYADPLGTHGQSEQSDGSTVSGHYFVADPENGHQRRVDYVADAQGFRAQVSSNHDQVVAAHSPVHHQHQQHALHHHQPLVHASGVQHSAQHSAVPQSGYYSSGVYNGGYNGGYNGYAANSAALYGSNYGYGSVPPNAYYGYSTVSPASYYGYSYNSAQQPQQYASAYQYSAKPVQQQQAAGSGSAYYSAYGYGPVSNQVGVPQQQSRYYSQLIVPKVSSVNGVQYVSSVPASAPVGYSSNVGSVGAASSPVADELQTKKA